MEIADFYELDHPRGVWRTKVLEPLIRKLEHGDKVYLHDRPSGTLRVNDATEYLFSLGCTRVMKATDADVIIIDYYTLSQEVKYYNSEMPAGIHSYLLRLSDMSDAKDFYSKVKDFKVNSGAILTLDYSTYENIWNLFKSGDKENIKIAIAGLIRCNWKNDKFLLDFITFKFNDQLLSNNLGQFPGWSDFANYHKIPWKDRRLRAYRLVDKISTTGITPEQAILITKLTK